MNPQRRKGPVPDSQHPMFNGCDFSGPVRVVVYYKK